MQSRLMPADIAVANPPRTGLGPEVAAHLAARPPARFVYISCDPATLARDAARLAPVFRLISVKAFDLFPQTSHVETVARFDRA
jgi:23S rRNA (uracil1939-C5)-methyltransferase